MKDGAEQPTLTPPPLGQLTLSYAVLLSAVLSVRGGRLISPKASGSSPCLSPLQPHPASLLEPRLSARLIELLNFATCIRPSLASRPLLLFLPWIPRLLTPPSHLASIGKCLLNNKNNSSLHLLSTYSVLSASQMLSCLILTTTMRKNNHS